MVRVEEYVWYTFERLRFFNWIRFQYVISFYPTKYSNVKNVTVFIICTRMCVCMKQAKPISKLTEYNNKAMRAMRFCLLLSIFRDIVTKVTFNLHNSFPICKKEKEIFCYGFFNCFLHITNWFVFVWLAWCKIVKKII